MRKVIIIFGILTLLGGCSIALAHTGEKAIHEILGIPEPSLLPGHPFYFFKEIGWGFRRFFTFDPIKRAELELTLSDDRLAEFGKLLDASGTKKAALDRALNNYLDAQKRLGEKLASLKDKNKNIDALLEKLAARVFDHQKLFDELRDETGDETKNMATKIIAENVKRAFELDKQKFEEGLENKIKKETDDFKNPAAWKNFSAIAQELNGELKSFTEKIKESIYKAQDKEKKNAIARCGPKPLRATPSGCTGPICKGERWEFECPAKEKPRQEKCIIGGCNGELCQSADEPPLSSICIYTEKYSCYKQARCEIQTNGKCEWTKTPELNACVEKTEGKTTPAIPPPPASRPPPTTPPEVKPITKEFIIEADDIAFYPSTAIAVAKGTVVKITFMVRSTNVYYGGLDFRSPKFNTEPIKPGGATAIQFTADTSFTITSYWPASGIKKADLKVEVQ